MSQKSTHDKLRTALVCLAGHDVEAQRRYLAKYSSFSPPGSSRERVAESVESMSGDWALVTLEKLLDAVKNGHDHFIFDENGERVQYRLF